MTLDMLGSKTLRREEPNDAKKQGGYERRVDWQRHDFRQGGVWQADVLIVMFDALFPMVGIHIQRVKGHRRLRPIEAQMQMIASNAREQQGHAQ